MTTYGNAGDDITILFDGQRFEGTVTAHSMMVPIGGYMEGTIVYVTDGTTYADEDYKYVYGKGKVTKSDETFTWTDGKGRVYEIKRAVADFEKSDFECDDMEDHMKNVYQLVVVNRETGVVWDGGLFTGDRDMDLATQTVLLDRADEIKAIGAPDVVEVFLCKRTSYEEIDE